MTKTVYEWAREFVDLGISTFPVYYRNKTPKGKWERYQKELCNADELKKWFLGGSLHNYGVVAGWQGLVILDFDSMARYYEWQLWVLGQDKDSPADMAATLAFKVQTSRGIHVYLHIPEALNNAHIEGLDIKSHGYVLGPGSVHPSGAIYKPYSDAILIPIVPSLKSVLPETWMDEFNHLEPETTVSYMSQVQADPFDLASNPLKTDQDLIKQIRERHKIEDYIKDRRPTGAGWEMGLCPFHDDQSPSFWIDTRRQIGNCQKCNFPRPLDVINLFARLKRISDKDAIVLLAKQ